MRLEIKKLGGIVIYSGEATTVAELLVNAVKDGANLDGANLVGAYLRGAYLRGANLDGANLRGANWGEGAKIGEQVVRWVDPLVVCDGYCKSLCAVGDVAWIMAGCRWFTLADARKHWADRPDRITTRLMLEGIARVGEERGLKEC